MIQARTLYSIVQEAKKHNWRCPTPLGSWLAQRLYPNLTKNIRHDERKAIAFLYRINDKHNCFVKRGKDWFVKEQDLITEPESAAYMVALNDFCLNDYPESRANKSVLHEYLREKLHLDATALESLFKLGVKKKYIACLPNGQLRVGHRTTEQLPYLKLLVENFRPSN